MLRVWLPLTKDLRQQGLSNVTITNNGATYESSGKLGGCYNLTNGPINITNLPNPTSISVAFWFKRTANTNTRQFMFTAWSGVTCELTTDGKPTFAVYRDNYPTITGPTAITTSTGWIHYCGTFSPIEGMKMYLNGELVASNTNTTAISWSTTTGQIGKYGSYASMSAQMDDVRIYDHCLSPMEVKELAKGLVLHYPLNRQGWGQENLLKNSNFLQGTNGMQGYTATSATCTKQTDCMKVVSTSASGGFYTSNFNSITTGDMTTFSADVKADNNMTIYIGTDGSGNGSCQAYTIGTSWQRIHISKAKTTNNANLRIYGNGTFYAKNLKYELGSIATPWCPNSSDALATTMGLNSTTEYDCSGFCNNGTRTGTFSWTSDTPKYAVSTKFNGAEVIVVPFTCGSISEAITVACWGYESNWNTSTAERLLGAATNSSGWCIGDYGSENTLFAFYANGGYNVATGFKQLSTGWHHFVITFDGLNLIYYVDGQQFSKKTFSTKQVATGNYNINIGRHYGGSYNFKGNMSDVRIYATALSADDVKSLYQNCATIDPDGTIRGQIRS